METAENWENKKQEPFKRQENLKNIFSYKKG